MINGCFKFIAFISVFDHLYSQYSIQFNEWTEYILEDNNYLCTKMFVCEKLSNNVLFIIKIVIFYIYFTINAYTYVYISITCTIIINEKRSKHISKSYKSTLLYVQGEIFSVVLIFSKCKLQCKSRCQFCVAYKDCYFIIS